MGQAGRYEASPVQRGVRVSSFAMDAYEVSVARFRAFWNARSRDGGASVRSRPVAYPDGGSIAWSGSATEPAAITPTASHPEWLTWTPTPRGYEAHPIVGVTWWTAMEFCAWDGGRLPTEAEWEYAARGRVSRCDGLFAGRDFPWGDATPARPCTLAQLDGCGRHDGRATAPVGSFAPWGGLYDMAGNAFELTADVYAPFTYVPCWPGIAQVNPRCQQWLRANHVIRGGSFATSITYAQSARRDADLSYTGTGFRCARSR